MIVFPKKEFKLTESFICVKIASTINMRSNVLNKSIF